MAERRSGPRARGEALRRRAEHDKSTDAPDGTELSFAAADRGFMSVSVTTSRTVQFGKPKLLFRLDEGVSTDPWMANVSRDAGRFVIAVPPTRHRQIAVFDRQGTVVGTVGRRGLYGDTFRLSPDGKRLALVRNDPQTGNNDIWTVDMATGKGTPVTNDTPPESLSRLVGGWEAGGLCVDPPE